MKADPEKAARWQKHIEAIKSSGSTRRTYCEKNGLNLSTSKKPGRCRVSRITPSISLTPRLCFCPGVDLDSY
jgi:hypothetical protein